MMSMALVFDNSLQIRESQINSTAQPPIRDQVCSSISVGIYMVLIFISLHSLADEALSLHARQRGMLTQDIATLWNTSTHEQSQHLLHDLRGQLMLCTKYARPAEA